MSWATIASISGLLISFIGCIIAIIRVIKTDNGSKKVISILSEIPSLCAEAEKIFGSGNGASKFSWVMQNIQIKALKSNVTLSDELITQNIEGTIACRNTGRVE